MKIVIMLPKTKITGLKEISKRKRSLTHTHTHPLYTPAHMRTNTSRGRWSDLEVTHMGIFQINNSINKNSNDIQKEKFVRVKISTKGK